MARLNSPADSIVSGFVISGTTPRNVLVRAVGPSLATFGVNDALTSVVLSVHQGDRLVGSNNGWAGPTRTASPETVDAFDRAGAFRFVDEASLDSALVLSLAPGAYTVQVKSGDTASGAALLEVFDLP
jgi:hypothetical protein